MRSGFSHAVQLASISILLALVAGGCRIGETPRYACNEGCLSEFQRIEYTDSRQWACGAEGYQGTAPPLTVANFSAHEPWPMTLEEAIELSLANSKVLEKLGGVVLAAPQAVATSWDPALLETDPRAGAEAALSAFDARFTGNANLNRSERKFNNLFFGAGATTLNSNTGNLRAGLDKTTASGTQYSVFSSSDYSRTNSPGNRFPSAWDTILQAEIRQPLARGAGTAVTRIAGPNGQPGIYNGVLIGRIRGDIALADFEAAVRDLTRDVERSYWELYFAWRDLDVQLRARESARLIWENRDRRVAAGLSRPDDEAQTRQQYFQFEQQVIDATSGNASGQTGVLGAERQLRRLLGLRNSDGRVIRPVTEPTIAPVLFDWNEAQDQAIRQRVEIRRQKWVVRQRELELCAARKLNQWQVDLTGNYAARGFGDDLAGNRGLPEGSAFADLFTGQLDDWGLGLEIQGPVGNRIGHLAVRNAELQLTREYALLDEQQKQLLLDLNAAFAEVERSFTSIRNSWNVREAVRAELEPKRRRAEAGDEDVFFLLDAQQRASSSETAFHRAVVDYNLALQSFVYTAGGLLEHYNIQLLEGPWDASTAALAAEQQSRFRFGPVEPAGTDIGLITSGPVDQQTDLTIISPTVNPESLIEAPAEEPQSGTGRTDFDSADDNGNGGGSRP